MSYLVLHVRHYNFEGRDGRRVTGSAVTYLDLEAPPSEDEIGAAPLQLSADASISKQFTAAPAFYDLAFKQRRGRDGKPQLMLAGARLVAQANLARPPTGGATVNR